MSPAAILDFDKVQKMALRHVAHCPCLPSRQNLVTIAQVAAELFRFSKWRPVAILHFVVATKRHHGTLLTVDIYRRTKLGEDISKSG